MDVRQTMELILYRWAKSIVDGEYYIYESFLVEVMADTGFNIALADETAFRLGSNRIRKVYLTPEQESWLLLKYR